MKSLLKNHGKVIFAIAIGVLVSNIIPMTAPTQMMVNTELNSTAPANTASTNIVALTTVAVNTMISTIATAPALANGMDSLACRLASLAKWTNPTANWACELAIAWDDWFHGWD